MAKALGVRCVNLPVEQGSQLVGYLVLQLYQSNIIQNCGSAGLHIEHRPADLIRSHIVHAGPPHEQSGDVPRERGADEIGVSFSASQRNHS